MKPNLEDAWLMCAKAVRGIAAAFAARRRTDPDEALSQAHEAFVMAWRSWDADAGVPLEKWVAWKVSWGLKKRPTKYQSLRDRDADLGLVAARSGWLDRLMADLGDDAREAALLACSAPLKEDAESLRGADAEGGRRRWTMREAMRDALSLRLCQGGWGAGRVTAAFDEIREALA